MFDEESPMTNAQLALFVRKDGDQRGSNRFINYALLILIFATAYRTRAQEVPTLSVNVNVVSLLATVHDHRGRLINNLTANDFLLKEDGIPQKIRYFSRETDLPLTIGLLIDTSRSQAEVLEKERSASITFLNQVLREGKDKAFVVEFDERVQALQGLTSSREKLTSALGQLTIPDQVATLLYSAIQQSSENLMSKQQGRKAFILLTDGVAYKDPVSIGAAIESAQRADTIIYTIRFSGSVHAYRPARVAVIGVMKERGKLELGQMTQKTGGTSYGVTKNRTIETIYSQIEDELRNQYSIGYTPMRLSADGMYHKIELTTKDRNLIVDTRDGYYAK
jgi:VWFA-related protein